MTGALIDLRQAARPQESISQSERAFSRQQIMWLVALSLVSIALRFDYQLQRFWVDEALTVGISARPLSAIPALLRLDGSPPLYYLVLHGWMDVFGQSEPATHALSMVFAVINIPVAFWAGKTLFGTRAGWFTAVLTATNPYLALYSGETRMYTMVVLFAMVATVAYLKVFAYRQRRYLAAFVVFLTLLLYTHNWALFLILGLLAALVPCLIRASDRRRVVLDALIAFGVPAVAYLPWVPTLLYQSANTAAPWSARPILRELVSAFGFILGDERALVALVLAGGASVLGLLLQPRLKEGAAVWAAGTLTGVTLLAGWVVSQANPAWAGRYFGVFVPATLLIAALGLSRGNRQGLIALGLILIFWVQPLGRLTGVRATSPYRKSVASLIAGKTSPLLKPGDWVIALQMEELPVFRYYFGSKMRFATALGPQKDPEIVDWRNAEKRMAASSVAGGLTPMLDSAPVGTRFLVVCYRFIPAVQDRRWFHIMNSRCGQWKKAFASDPRFEAVRIPNLTKTKRLEDASRFVRLYGKVAG